VTGNPEVKLRARFSESSGTDWPAGGKSLLSENQEVGLIPVIGLAAPEGAITDSNDA
jgi:hypothetical protein